MIQSGGSQTELDPFLSIWTKFLCAMTFFLIFAGAMVTSTDSGLAVPDWPLSYGMLFPPMIGGVFYEHGHRMVASFVGFLTLILFIVTRFKVKDVFKKRLALLAFLMVCCQGLLGGVTVLLGLPIIVSVTHSLLGQTFLLITVALAFYYHFNFQKTGVQLSENKEKKTSFLRLSIFFLVLLYLQNFLGACVRHTHSALAIYDVPLNLGRFIPSWDEAAVEQVNQWAFQRGLDFIESWQIVLNFLHRVGAVVVLAMMITLVYKGLRLFYHSSENRVSQLIIGLLIMLLFQIFLGLATVATETNAVITSFHVLGGVVLLALSLLLILEVKRCLSK